MKNQSGAKLKERYQTINDITLTILSLSASSCSLERLGRLDE
jgi:hypothetical protein